MADLLVRVRVRTNVNDIIGSRFEKVRNGHRFEHLKQDIDLRIGHPFQNLKKGHRTKVQMSVTLKTDMDLRLDVNLSLTHLSKIL
jgi:hypothetical protein